MGWAAERRSSSGRQRQSRRPLSLRRAQLGQTVQRRHSRTGPARVQELRKRARQLEAEIDGKLVNYNRISVAQVFHRGSIAGRVARVPLRVRAGRAVQRVPAPPSQTRLNSRGRAGGGRRTGHAALTRARPGRTVTPRRPRSQRSSRPSFCRCAAAPARPSAQRRGVTRARRAQLSEVNEQMGHCVGDIGAGDGQRLGHVLQRHRELLHDYDKEFRKVRAPGREGRVRVSVSVCVYVCMCVCACVCVYVCV
jgi:hypothetical protein